MTIKNIERDRKAMQLGLLYTDPDIEYAYYYVLQPGEPVFSHVKGLKVHSDNLIGTNSIDNPPHITFLLFLMFEKNEAKLIAATENVIQNIEAPKLYTSGIEIFPSSKTVYLSIKNQEEIHKIGNRFIDSFARALLIKKGSVKSKTRNLHITIVKGVEKEKLEPLNEYLKQFEIEPMEFSCSKLVLMQQDIRSGKSGKKRVVKIFNLAK